ncbi:rhodanese-like domain-containing protein [Bordetella petrii]|uniref:rhodanese-like domain-containing protein n=1 Tax=Bordetella petrii TaxID=94624 RepID=UPI001E56D752|nr:rhodanese-like domain-containing protein [Bordetella petrii]MCD0505966.1 rhodanese-like domain-containing protein [Bordetella petrii]
MDLLQFLVDKNNIFIVAVALVSGVMLAVPALRKGRSGGGISTTEAIQLANQRQAVWVDVRPAEQFRAGHIAQARNLPAAELEQKAGSLPKNKPLVIVCDTGREAGRVASRLRSQGFAEVSVMEGGMRAWSSAGLPVTQKP